MNSYIITVCPECGQEVSKLEKKHACSRCDNWFDTEKEAEECCPDAPAAGNE